MGCVVCRGCQSVVGGGVLLGGDIWVAHHGCCQSRNEISCKPSNTMLEAEFSDGTLQQMLLYKKLYKKCQRMAINIVTVLLFLADFFFKLQAHFVI